ncbi:C10 family peptidase [candidate division KSB1 bacterium]
MQKLSNLLNILYSILRSSVILIILLTVVITKSFAQQVDSDMVRKAALTFLNNQSSVGLQKQKLSTSISDIIEIKNDLDEISAFIVELQKEGFLILSANKSIRPVLGYSNIGNFTFEDSPQNILLHLVQWDVEARLKNLELNNPGIENLVNTNNKLWESYIEGNIAISKAVNISQIWGPLITTQWHQRSPYNNYCPIDPYTGYRSIVGCVATATGQIINYWKYPKSIYFTNEDAYSSQGDNGAIRIPEDSDVSFSTLNNELANIEYNGDQNELGYLCYAIGIIEEMNYSSSGSGAYMRSSFYKKLGYGSADIDRWYNASSEVIDDIKNGYPVQISITKTNAKVGHSVIIDGYNESNGFYHVNMGWGGSQDAWYLPPNIGSYNVMRSAIYNISPYQSWPQVGGTVTNSYRTPYTFPETAPALKWAITVPEDIPDYSDYGFDNSIVGTGNKVYASISSSWIGSGYSPYISVLNPYGYIEKNIKIDDSDSPMNHLAQNSRGEIFFGNDNSQDKVNVYKLDPETEIVSKIFTSSIDGGMDNPLKVDSNDNIYFVINSKYTTDAYRLYCIRSNGTINWSHVFAINDRLFDSCVAIDEVRNYIYINYYNTSTQKSYIKCFDEIGLLRWIHELPGTYYSSYMAKPVSIGTDGTVFVGCYTNILALSPVNGNEIWSTDFYPALVNYTPTIGKDGTLYIRHGKYVSDNWTPGFISAVDPSNGSIKWEAQITPALDSYDFLEEIYSDNNNMIIFSYDRDGVKHLSGLLDNGSSGEILWDIEYGGKINFDSGDTIYLIPHTVEASIYALSIGELGDPNGLAKGWTNNLPPNEPENPQPEGVYDLTTNEITLSWTCSDPDNNDLSYDIYLGDAKYMMTKKAGNRTSNSINISTDSLSQDSLYIWKIIASDGQATTEGPTWSFYFTDDKIVSVNEEVITPIEYVLDQNYPNPFNPVTTISFQLRSFSEVSLKIYNINGQVVKTLISGKLPAGNHTVKWDGRNEAGQKVSSGIYIYHIRAGGFTATKKMILIK